MNKNIFIFYVFINIFLLAMVALVGIITDTLSGFGLWVIYFWLIFLNSISFFSNSKLYKKPEGRSGKTTIKASMWSIDAILALYVITSIVFLSYFSISDINGFFKDEYFWISQLAIASFFAAVVSILFISEKLAVSGSVGEGKKHEVLLQAKRNHRSIESLKLGSALEVSRELINFLEYQLPHENKLSDSYFEIGLGKLVDLGEEIKKTDDTFSEDNFIRRYNELMNELKKY